MTELVQQSEAWNLMLKKYFVEDTVLKLGGMNIFLREGSCGIVGMCSPGYASYSKLPSTIKEIELAFKLLKDGGVKLFTVMTSPFNHVGRKSLPFDYVTDNHIQYIDLQKPFEYSRQVRSRIRKISKNCQLRIWNASKKEFKTWYKIHVKRSEEQGSHPLPREWFESVLTLDEATLKVVNYKGKIIGGTIFLKNSYCCDYYRSAFDSKYFKLNGNTWQLFREIEECKEAGIEKFNMQSCKVRNDGTWKFKASFGARESEHFYLTKVLCSKRDLLPFVNNINSLRTEYHGFYIMPFKRIYELRNEVS